MGKKVQRRNLPNNYVHYDLGKDISAQKKYDSSLNRFINQVNEKKLASAYAKRVQNVYKPNNPQELKQILQAGSYLQGTRFSEMLSNISKSITTNILTASNVTRSKGTLYDVNGNKLTSSSQEAQVLFQNIESMMNKLSAVFSQNDTGAYLVLLKDIFRGDPEVLNVLNKMGSKGNHILSKNRINQLNAGMKANYQNLMSKMEQVRSMSQALAAKQNMNVKNVVGGDIDDAFMTKLAKSCVTPIAVLGGAMNETLVSDITSISKIMSMVNKEVFQGLRLGKRKDSFFINNITHTGTKGKTTSASFKTNTTDVKMNLMKNRGTVQINIPVGVSLKMSANSTKGNIQNVMIKTSTFHKLKLITQTRVIPGVWSQDTDVAMANVFGNHGNDNKNNRTPYKYGNLYNLLNKINLSFLVAGLAGNLTASDLATVFIVNGDIYNIYDMIGKGYGKSITGGLNSGHVAKIQSWNKWERVAEDKGKRKNLVQNEDKSLARSQAFYENLMEGRKKLSLSLKLSMKI